MFVTLSPRRSRWWAANSMCVACLARLVDAVVQVIQLVITLCDAARLLLADVHQGPHRGAQLLPANLLHPWNLLQDRRGRFRRELLRELGDVDGVVAHPLEL